MNMEKLTWDEIQDQYDQEWVELIDYEWKQTEPYPLSGVVRCHAKERKELSKLVQNNPVDNSAILFIGAWNLPADSIANFNKHKLSITPK